MELLLFTKHLESRRHRAANIKDSRFIDSSDGEGEKKTAIWKLVTKNSCGPILSILAAVAFLSTQKP